MLGLGLVWDILKNIGLFLMFWTILNLAIIIFKWCESAILKPADTAHEIDLRDDKSAIGKVFTIAVIKANPFKNTWFGHIWIDWHQPLPHSGIKEVGIYAKCRTTAALSLFGAVVSPFAIFFGQKPIESVIIDDSDNHRDWELHIRTDEETFAKLMEIDRIWMNETRYVLRPPLGGKTYSCRDYCMQIAEAVGLKVRHDRWADFPPISFRDFLIDNGIIADKKLNRVRPQKPAYAIN